MSALRYNPLTYRDNLVDSGMNERIANVIAQQQDQIISEILNNNLATKEDMTGLLKCLHVIQMDIKSLENRMTIKFGGMMLIGVGLLTFILRHN